MGDEELTLQQRIEKLKEIFTEEELDEIDYMFAHGLACDADRIMGIKVETPGPDTPFIEEPEPEPEPAELERGTAATTKSCSATRPDDDAAEVGCAD